MPWCYAASYSPTASTWIAAIYRLIPSGARASLARGETFAGILSPRKMPRPRRTAWYASPTTRKCCPTIRRRLRREPRLGRATPRPGCSLRPCPGSRAPAAADNPQDTIELCRPPPASSRRRRAAGHRPPPRGTLNLRGLQGVLDLRTQFGSTLPMGTDLARFYDILLHASDGGVAPTRRTAARRRPTPALPRRFAACMSAIVGVPAERPRPGRHTLGVLVGDWCRCPQTQTEMSL